MKLNDDLQWIDLYLNNKEDDIIKYIYLMKNTDKTPLYIISSALSLELGISENGLLVRDFQKILTQEQKRQDMQSSSSIKSEQDISTYFDETKLVDIAKNLSVQKNSLPQNIIESSINQIKKLINKQDYQQKFNTRIYDDAIKYHSALQDGLNTQKNNFLEKIKLNQEQFNKTITLAGTRIAIAIYYGINLSGFIKKYGDDFYSILYYCLIFGDYEQYGFKYSDLTNNLIKQKILSQDDLFEISLSRGVQEGVKYLESMPLGYEDLSVEQKADNYKTRVENSAKLLDKIVSKNKKKLLFYTVARKLSIK